MSEQTPSESSGIGKAIKRYLITGLLVWLPITITLWVVTYIVSTTDHLFNLLPAQWQPESYLGFNIPGLGFILAIVVLFVTGVLGANVLGRKVIEGWDSLLGRIPVVKSIYSSVKKVSDRFVEARKMMEQMAGGKMPGMPGMGGGRAARKQQGKSRKRGQKISGNPAKRKQQEAERARGIKPSSLDRKSVV